METPQQPQRDQVDPAPEDEVPTESAETSAPAATDSADGDGAIDPDGDPANRASTPHSDAPAEGPDDDA